jgi:hypothetical protein
LILQEFNFLSSLNSLVINPLSDVQLAKRFSLTLWLPLQSSDHFFCCA